MFDLDLFDLRILITLEELGHASLPELSRRARLPARQCAERLRRLAPTAAWVLATAGEPASLTRTVRAVIGVDLLPGEAAVAALHNFIRTTPEAVDYLSLRDSGACLLSAAVADFSVLSAIAEELAQLSLAGAVRIGIVERSAPQSTSSIALNHRYRRPALDQC